MYLMTCAPSEDLDQPAQAMEPRCLEADSEDCDRLCGCACLKIHF